ncbi:hypothetical protein E8R49_10240 [Escherichia coli]|nr:hypothetical protein E8R49_10240 [Escherichia coli]
MVRRSAAASVLEAAVFYAFTPAKTSGDSGHILTFRLMDDWLPRKISWISERYVLRYVPTRLRMGTLLDAGAPPASR